jgi:hypothetical protein
MKTMKRLAVVATAILASATVASAGTKYATNLVSNSPVDPPPNPTLSAKSQMKLSDKGAIAIQLAGVTDGAGAPANSSTSYNDTKDTSPVLDGSEYVAIIKMVIPAVQMALPPPGIVEVPVPVDLKGGKGKTKLSAAPLLVLIGPGIGRSIEIVGTEVWGPLGSNAASCQAIVASSLPASITSPDPACRGGSQIGISGLSIAQP